MAIGSTQYVLRAYVAVQNAVRMHVLQAQSDLVEDEPAEFLRELVVPLADDISEVYTFHHFVDIPKALLKLKQLHETEKLLAVEEGHQVALVNQLKSLYCRWSFSEL